MPAPVPVFQFGAFYNLDLDFSPGQAITMNGKVHVNGTLWMCPQATATFNDTVEATGVVTNRDNPNDQQNLIFNSSYLHYNGGPPLSHMAPLFLSSINANINPANPEAILNLPPAGTGVPNLNAYVPSNQIYLYNECDLIISNSFTGINGNSRYGTNLSVYFSDYYNSMGRLVLVTNDVQWITTNLVVGVSTNKITNGYYSFVTNVAFYDFREGKTVQAVQINVAKLGSWLTNFVANGGNRYNQTNLFDKGYGIDSIYVYNSVPLTSTQLPAVRVVNGQELPSPKGLTIATPMPLYVLGDYNIKTNLGGSTSLLTTNTAWTWPAALMGDAITILSANWVDNQPAYLAGGSYTARNAVNTTINAACLMGIVSSTNVAGVKHYSGGLENFLRLEENWNGDILCYNGSIVAMFPSLYATNFWIGPGIYYGVPTRQWGFDANFMILTKLPPLTPAIANTNPPAITAQPQSLTVAQGSNATFNVTAGGFSPLNYQWKFNGTDILAATSASLTLTNVQLSQTGNYAVAVTNLYGSVLSSNAVLTVVTQPPFISAQPTNKTIFVNGTAIFGVTAAGSSPLSYQWSFNGTNLVGATNDLLMLFNVQTDQAGSYAVQVTNPFGVTNSTGAVLTVLTQPPTIQKQPANQTVILGGSTIFSVTAAGSSPLSYQWQFNGADIVGATNLSLIFDNVQTDNQGPYQVVVTNAYGSITSSIATLTVTRSLVVAWGDNIFGETNVPAGLKNVTAISAGFYHDLALQADRTVVAWGANGSGQSSVPVDLTNVVAIAGGGFYSLALRANGNVVGWGDNGYGQINIPPNLTNAVAVTAGYYHSLALQANGTVVAWGYNAYNQTNVPAGLTNVVAIAAGGYHSLALRANGTVVAWGHDGYGQADVPAGLTNIVAIAAGQFHSLALQANGTVVGWGEGDSGQTNVPTGLTNAVAIAACGYFSLALQANGTVVGWGDDFYGEINLPASLTNVVAIAAGFFHSLALENDGSPVILRQPTSQTTLNSATILFNVTAVGRPQLSYQWQKDGASLTDGGTVSGATTGALTLVNVQTNDAGIYALVVTNDFGSITSSNAVLTVLTLPPKIQTQPTNQTVLVNGTATFGVTATGSLPLGYQWSFNGTNIDGATNASLMLSSVQLSQAGNYAVEVANAYGTTNSTSAVLTVVDLPPAILAQPADQTMAVEGTAIFSVTATGFPPLSYQWNFNGTNLDGATNASLTLANVQMSQAGSYAVLVTNAYGSVLSSNALLTVDTAPPCDPVPSGLTQWWPAEGTAMDIIGGSNGVMYAGTTFSSGIVGQAFNFDGTNGCVMNTNTAPLTNIQNSFTIEFWACPRKGFNLLPEGGGIGNTGQSYAVFPDWGGTSGSRAGVGVCVGTNGISVIEHAASYMPSMLSYPALINGWVHVAVVYSNKQPTLYLNGVSVRTGITSSRTFIYPSKDLGGSCNVAGFPFKSYGLYNGLLDEVSIYNRALASDEIQAIYSATVAGKCTTPFIGLQPTNQTVNAGGLAMFSVTAAGSAPLSYQWSFNGTNLDGATNSLLLLTNVQPGNAGGYIVLVTNLYGSVLSSNAVLTVLVPPSITLQPASSANVAGTTANFNVAADGTAPLSYQWQWNGTNLDDATNAILTLDNVTLDQAGNYSVIVTNLAGSITSSNAVLSVYATAAATLGAYSFSSDTGFQFQVVGVPGYNYDVQASTNLMDWVPLITNTAPFIFTDTDTGDFPQQFYRAIYAP